MSTIAPETKFKKFVIIDPKVTRRVKIIDKLANFIIKSGGILVILVVALIFLFIGKETIPLWLPGTAEPLVKTEIKQFAAPHTPLIMGVDEYQTFAYFVEGESAQVDFYDLQKGQMINAQPFTKLAGKQISCAYRTPAFDYLFLGTSDGHVLLAKVSFTPDLSTGSRIVTPTLKEYGMITIPGTKAPIQKVFGRVSSEGEMVYAAVTAEQKVYFGKMTLDAVELMEQNQGLLEGEAASTDRESQSGAAPSATAVDYAFDGKINQIAIDRFSEKLFVVTDKNILYQFYLENDLTQPYATYDSFVNESGVNRKITAMEFLIGDVTVVFGFNDGTTEGWFGVRAKEGDWMRKIQPIHKFESIGGSITTIVPSARNKAFIAGSDNGHVALNFSTSDRRLLDLEISGPVALAAYAPKLTQILALSGTGSFESFDIHVPYPEISLKTLFGKVWYEGYDKPEFSWQSSGGTDDFEPKFSLTPLFVGTLKGAFYGLLFAIPIAVFGALYTSQFMHPSIKTYVKPTIEIMAALPSVVIGFLAGLWLAPLLENKLVMIFLFSIFIPVGTVIAALLWNKIPIKIKMNIPPGVDLVAIIVTTLIAAFLSYKVGVFMDFAYFGGDIRQWIFSAIGEQVEQRNCIVIGLAMGFAVIPIIFTISEDAFSNVPKSFTSASYAMGASPWQTATRVILPTASPGVFSAVMIGFGRAVGETMIVLMATGNTPIMSFSPFNGMRTLSANIAVEIPEAPVGETHYRVLFVAAMLLFILTFTVNTFAEVIRQRLREKYKAV